MSMLTSLELGKINNLRQLKAYGFVYTSRGYVPEGGLRIDGCTGDYGEWVYKHPETGQEVTLARSREFGFFDVYEGDRLGDLHYS